MSHDTTKSVSADLKFCTKKVTPRLSAFWPFRLLCSYLAVPKEGSLIWASYVSIRKLFYFFFGQSLLTCVEQYALDSVLVRWCESSAFEWLSNVAVDFVVFCWRNYILLNSWKNLTNYCRLGLEYKTLVFFTPTPRRKSKAIPYHMSKDIYKTTSLILSPLAVSFQLSSSWNDLCTVPRYNRQGKKVIGHTLAGKIQLYLGLH